MAMGLPARPFFFEAQPIFLQPASRDGPPFSMIDDLRGKLAQMKDLYRAPQLSPVPKNPCAADIARTGCKDAACLKRFAESLSGGCAELMLKPVLKPVPQPSPAPMARSLSRGASADVVSQLLSQLGEPRQPKQRAEPDGYFTMVTSDGAGHSKTISGPIGGAGAPTLPPELAQLAEMMPSFNAEQLLPEMLGQMFPGMLGSGMLGSMLGSVAPRTRAQPERREAPRHEYPVASIGDDPEEVAAAKAYKHHPCGDEIMQCRQITAHDTASIKKCLFDHLDDLSPKCKCFVTQMEGPAKMQQQLPASAKAAAAPVVHTTSGPTIHVTVLEDTPESVHSAGRYVEVQPVVIATRAHGTPCFFMMTATFILALLVLRKCLLCLCRPPVAAANLAVVVPPEQTSIALVEPLKTEDIKTVTVVSK